jgi:hypothetical protein
MTPRVVADIGDGDPHNCLHDHHHAHGEHAMSPIPQAHSLDDCSAGCDKVIIQTYEGDIETKNLRLTATIVTSMAELRARAAAGCAAAA